MASTETVIANLALLRMGQASISSIDGTDVLSVKVNTFYDQARDELLGQGPELGWDFARKTNSGIDVDDYTITSIADLVAGETITVTATHTLAAGDMVELTGSTGYDGTYDVISVSTTVSFVIAATFVTTGTGTARWLDNEYAYRYPIPSGSKKVISVKVGGIEITDWNREGIYIQTNMEDEEVDITFVQGITDVTLFPDHFVNALAWKLAVDLTLNLTQDKKAAQMAEEKFELALDKATAVDEREKYVKEESSSWQDAGNITETLE